MDMVAPVVCPAFYSPRPDSYTVTQDSIGAPSVLKSLYNNQGIKCYRKLMMVRTTHGMPHPIGLTTW
jgi:hypothetical protein